MIDGAFASRTLIAQFPDGAKKEICFSIGPILNNEKMLNYSCGISCNSRFFKDAYIAGIDQIDAVSNAIRFLEDFIKENNMEIKFFWMDHSTYDIPEGQS